MHKSYPILYLSLALTVVFAVFHFVSTAFYLYWSYWWTDVVMHTFAGICGGLATYSVLFELGFWRFTGKEYPRISHRILIVFLCVMVVGVAWEIFEYVFDMTYAPEGYVLDTTVDLILDGTGAIVATYFAVKRKDANV